MVHIGGMTRLMADVVPGRVLQWPVRQLSMWSRAEVPPNGYIDIYEKWVRSPTRNLPKIFARFLVELTEPVMTIYFFEWVGSI